MKKVVLLLVVLSSLLLVTSVFAGGAQEKEKEDDFKVGFVYVGPIGDNGWTQQHNKARLAVEEELGVETLYKENVPATQESEKVMRDMISQGADVIFATSFGYMDYVHKVASSHPDVVFFHSGGFKQADNVVNYLGRMYQARYLSGIVAGLKTETNKLGYIAAFDIPEVVRGINGFALGARSVNPDATVEVIWTHTWNDPPKEKEAAFSLVDNGCDVIAQHQSTPANIQAAEARDVWGIGYHAPMCDIAPKACLTSCYWNWEPYYTRVVKEIRNGTFEGKDYWGGMKQGVVQLSELTKIAPEAAADKVAKIEKEIKEGSFTVFSGPITDNEGKKRISESEALTDEQLLSMDWFVEGVLGSVGK